MKVIQLNKVQQNSLHSLKYIQVSEANLTAIILTAEKWIKSASCAILKTYLYMHTQIIVWLLGIRQKVFFQANLGWISF